MIGIRYVHLKLTCSSIENIHVHERCILPHCVENIVIGNSIFFREELFSPVTLDNELKIKVLKFINLGENRYFYK